MPKYKFFILKQHIDSLPRFSTALRYLEKGSESKLPTDYNQQPSRPRFVKDTKRRNNRTWPRKKQHKSTLHREMPRSPSKIKRTPLSKAE